jgi:hypothetical protein
MTQPKQCYARYATTPLSPRSAAITVAARVKASLAQD